MKGRGYLLVAKDEHVKYKGHFPQPAGLEIKTLERKLNCRFQVEQPS